MVEERNTATEEFEQAARTKELSFAREFLAFLGQNKKWWLLPILVVLLTLGGLAVLGGTAAAPFVYTLF